MSEEEGLMARRAAPLTLDDVNQAVSSMAREFYIAGRVKRERGVRGWSQAELARRMAKAGYPIPQTAISKIEQPQKGREPITRSVTVDEAIGFAKVFEVPLVELLLPEGILSRIEISRDLEAGVAAMLAKDSAVERYEGIVSRLSSLYRCHVEWRESIDEMHKAAKNAQLDPADQPGMRARFLAAVIEEGSVTP